VAGSWNPYCQSTGKFSANKKFELTKNNIKILKNKPNQEGSYERYARALLPYLD
jgi:hypothetical protein